MIFFGFYTIYHCRCIYLMSICVNLFLNLIQCDKNIISILLEFINSQVSELKKNSLFIIYSAFTPDTRKFFFKLDVLCCILLLFVFCSSLSLSVVPLLMNIVMISLILFWILISAGINLNSFICTFSAIINRSVVNSKRTKVVIEEISGVDRGGWLLLYIMHVFCFLLTAFMWSKVAWLRLYHYVDSFLICHHTTSSNFSVGKKHILTEVVFYSFIQIYMVIKLLSMKMNVIKQV